MTFSEIVKREITEHAPRASCCRRAMSYGILFDAQECGNMISVEIAGEEFAAFALSVIERQFSKTADVVQICKAGKKYSRISFESASMAQKLRLLSCEDAEISDYIEFKCGECRASFLRGVFLARATLTFSPGNNHLEYRIAHKERALALGRFLTLCGAPPKTAERKGVTGFYFKRGDQIEDNLNLMQANASFFEIMNKRIERDIKIQENRAVNCESVNIQRAVETAQKQLRAIEIIRSAGELERLESELRASIALRLENHDATMSELAQLHEPPITKSMLNARFLKVYKIAERIEKRTK